MKLMDLEDKMKNVNTDVKIIWDKSQPEEKFGKKIKSVIIADADSKEGEKSPTAFLDLYNDDIEKYKFGDKIRIIDSYSKLIQNGKGQFRLVNAREIQKIEEEQ
jgi:hypothetical protein